MAGPAETLRLVLFGPEQIHNILDRQQSQFRAPPVKKRSQFTARLPAEQTGHRTHGHALQTTTPPSSINRSSCSEEPRGGEGWTAEV